MAKKKSAGDESLQELEKLLIEDLHRGRSQKEKKRRLWSAIGLRLGVCGVLIALCSLIGLLPSVKVGVLAFLFFMLVEVLRFYGWDKKSIRFVKKILRMRGR